MRKSLTLLALLIAVASPAYAAPSPLENKLPPTTESVHIRVLFGKWCSGYNMLVHGAAELNIRDVGLNEQGMLFYGTYEWLGNALRNKEDAFKSDFVGFIDNEGKLRFSVTTAFNHTLSYRLGYDPREQGVLAGHGTNSRADRVFLMMMVKDKDVCEAGRED